jgi:hypothetical protein
MSWTRLCQRCSVDICVDNIVGLHTMSGEPARRWRAGMIRSAGGILPDDLQRIEGS